MSEGIPLDQRIAVIGASGRFPRSADLDAFWRNLAAGFDGISRFSEAELRAAGVAPELLAHPDYVRAKGVLEDADRFDAALFGFSPREAETLDPQHRVFLEAAWSALEDAGYDSSIYEGNSGVFAGAEFASYLFFNLQPAAGNGVRRDTHQLLFSNDKDFLATRVAYKLDLRGPAVSVQTACSTSLVAIHLACQSLLNGECDMALAGGVSVSAPLASGYLYQEGGIASPDGYCRPFDARAQGTLGGNGVGVVVLKRLEDAVEDGDAVRGVVLGSAVNNDGGVKAGYTAPSVEGQARVISEALALSQVAPADVAFVETHGTGTPLGDPIEIEALARARRDASGGSRPAVSCALGAVKANVGHLGSAAGVAGFLKALLALEKGRIPPTPHFERANPRIDLQGGGFHVNTELEGWPEGRTRRRAAVSSFGIGGTNAHAVLEEAPERGPSGPSRPWQILPLAARTGAVLERISGRLADHLEAEPAAPLADVAYTLQVGRRPLPARRFVLAREREDAVRALQGGAPRLSESTEGTGESRPSVVFLFPGQGVERAGMGRALYRSEPTFRRHFDACAVVVDEELGVDLREILSESEEARALLEDPRVVQPGLFAFEYALARLWGEWGVEPEAVLGHSLGEYVAAVVAGVFRREEALALVCARGRLMESAAPGAMLAIPRSIEEIEARLEPGLEVAAINAPDLCAVSGPVAAVERLEGKLRAEGIASRRLAASRAFHSTAVDALLEPFAREVAARTSPRPPRIPLVSGLTGRPLTAEEATDPGYWARQMREPVRFADGLGTLVAEGERLFLEMGPGRTLASLVRRHPAAGTSRAVASLPGRRGEPEEAELLRALGRMWLGGAAVDWQGFSAHEDRHRVRLPTYPFERSRFWIETPASEPTRTAAPPGRVRSPVAREAFLPGLPGGEQRSPGWVLLSGGGALAGEVAAVLGEGVEVRTVGPGPEDDPVVRAAGAVGDGPSGSPERGVAFLRTLGGAWDEDLAALASAAESLADRTGAKGGAPPPRLVVLTSGGLPIGGEELPAAGAAALLGMVRLLGRRYPDLSLRVLDLDGAGAWRDEELATAVGRELLRGEEALVAYRGRRRWVVEDEVVPAAGAGGGGFERGGVYGVVGALDGAGWAMAQHLSGALEGTVVALEADDLPPREEWSRLEAEGGAVARRITRARALGPAFRWVCCDWTRAEDLSRALDELEASVGTPSGLVVAPSLEPAGLPLEEPGGLVRSLEAARRGLLALERALEGRAYGFCALHAPVHESGSGGLEREALAVLMESAAVRNTSPLRPWVSLSLDGGEAAAGGGARPNVTLEEAFGALDGALVAGGPPRLVLVPEGESMPREDGDRHERPDLSAPYEAPRNELEEKLAEIWQELLGVERVGIHDDFYALGGHSLLATQVVARIKEVLPVELPMLEIFRSVQTIEEMAGAIEDVLLRLIEELPEDEVEGLL